MPADIPDQVEAHRLLVQVGTGRVTTDYPSGRQIFSQGEDADFVFFVQNGSVKLTTTSQDGLEDLIGIAHEGQFFGEACLHNVPVRLATATAIVDCRITSVTKAAMLSVLQEQPRFAKMFIAYLSAHNSWLKRELLDHLIISGDDTFTVFSVSISAPFSTVLCATDSIVLTHMNAASAGSILRICLRRLSR